MKKAIVFPSFWARPESQGIHEDDFYYDHPLPVDRKGWLPRCFESLRTLNDQSFEVLAVAGANTPEIEEETDSKMKSLVQDEAGSLDVTVFSYDEFYKLEDILDEKGLSEFKSVIDITGYSDLRNLCLVAANILDIELAISIDDDVVFHEKDYLSKVESGIKRNHDGEPVEALAGPYLHGDLELIIEEEEEAWTVPWHTTRSMNRAFEHYIKKGPRYHETPFAIMGNLAVTRDFYCEVPLDPAMRRGEDSDWLFNALMLDRRFVMDTEMPVHHKPPERPHPVWRSMREDIARFIYQRQKFHEAQSRFDHFPDLEFFKPFPGDFWDDDLEKKIKEACQLLSSQYLTDDHQEDARQTLQNYYLAMQNFSPVEVDPVQEYLDFQSRWVEFMAWVKDHSKELRNRLGMVE